MVGVGQGRCAFQPEKLPYCPKNETGWVTLAQRRMLVLQDDTTAKQLHNRKLSLLVNGKNLETAKLQHCPSLFSF